MSLTSKILIALLAVVLVMAAVHFTINGFPDLNSWNPHNR
jgi:hypothetical protein